MKWPWKDEIEMLRSEVAEKLSEIEKKEEETKENVKIFSDAVGSNVENLAKGFANINTAHNQLGSHFASLRSSIDEISRRVDEIEKSQCAKIPEGSDANSNSPEETAPPGEKAFSARTLAIVSYCVLSPLVAAGIVYLVMAS